MQREIPNLTQRLRPCCLAQTPYILFRQMSYVRACGSTKTLSIAHECSDESAERFATKMSSDGDDGDEANS